MKLLRIFSLTLILVASPSFSWAGALEDAQERVRHYPNDADARNELGYAYDDEGKYQNAIASYKEAIRIQPDDATVHNNLGVAYDGLGQYKKAIASFKEAIRIQSDDATAHNNLGIVYRKSGHNKEAIASYKEAIKIKPDYAIAHNNLGYAYNNEGQYQNAIASYKEALRIDPNHTRARNNLNKLEQNVAIDRLAHERKLLEKERKKLEDLRIDKEKRKQQPKLQPAYTGTGFLFSAKDYVITNWHVVRGAKNIKIKFLDGKEIKAEVALKDPQNDIAFLKLARQPQLPQSDLKIGDSSKVRMGDEVFTIGYPAYWLLGKNPKYTKGEVNALSGINDDPRVFQVSVQIQPGNSGGPLFNSKGEVIGITQATLDSKVAIGTFGTLPQNVNYAIKSNYISKLLPMLPQTLIAPRGVMVIPENALANFIEKAKKNIVLIEAKE